MKEAEYYINLPQDTQTKVQCRLCPHNCIIKPAELGKCQARKNVDGKLYSLNYGIVSSISFDPVEKKPLYHFFPGKMILSIGSWGCNFKCGFCQNWNISQEGINEKYAEQVSSRNLLDSALRNKNNIGIAYTYNEPLINIEFIKETAKLFSETGLKNVLVTNGFINQKPLTDLLPFIDAANIDLKSFNADFYKNICDGKLNYVLQTIETMVKNNKHIEITTLIIPGYNDSRKEIEQIIDFIASLSKNIPLHFSRYYPQYKFDVPATSVKTMVEFYNLAKQKLSYVYLGNITDENYNSTFCPTCGKKLISRIGYDIYLKNLNYNKCKYCDTEIKIIL